MPPKKPETVKCTPTCDLATGQGLVRMSISGHLLNVP